MAAPPLTAGERQRVLAHLEMTEAWLLSELDGLSDAQLTFRMTPDSWSIKDVVEHLAIAEPQYWQQLQDSLQQPLGFKSETTDATILWYGIDRTNRQTTGEARVPKGQFPSAREALAAVRKLRATMTQFARDTQEDLRGRAVEGRQDGRVSVAAHDLDAFPASHSATARNQSALVVPAGVSVTSAAALRQLSPWPQGYPGSSPPK